MSSWILKTNSFKVSELEADVIPCKKKQIVLMSLKKLSVYWFFAFVFAPIPGLHLVLPPIFLLIGVFAFFSQYKNTHFAEQGFYACPVCMNKIEIKKIYFYDGMKLNCDVCMEQMTLEPKT